MFIQKYVLLSAPPPLPSPSETKTLGPLEKEIQHISKHTGFLSSWAKELLVGIYIIAAKLKALGGKYQTV